MKQTFDRASVTVTTDKEPSKGRAWSAGCAPSGRGEADQPLTETGALLDALLENSPDAIYFKDRQSRFVHYSKSFFRLVGPVVGGSLKGKTDADIFGEEHARQALADEQEIIRTGNPIIGKLEKEDHPNGRVTWAMTNKMPWRNAAGEIIGIFGISKDVTALKEAEQEQARGRKLLRTLLDNVPDRIYFKDRQSRFVLVSKSKAQRAFQHSPELRDHLARRNGSGENGDRSDTDLIIGLTDFDVFTGNNAREAYQDEQEIIRTGKPLVDKPEKHTHLDGSVSWCLSTKMPWRGEDGSIIGTFGISRDITALKQAQAELENTHKRLVEASRLAGMDEVASDVLHNVGNALNSITVSCAMVADRVSQRRFANVAGVSKLLRSNIGHLDQLMSEDPKGKLIPEFLESAVQLFEEDNAFLVEELQRLRKHIEHVNQIVAMQQSYAMVAGVEENIELGQLVEDALQINSAGLDRHGIELRRQFEAAPPILVDKHKVLQILVNLISNAKYALSQARRADKLLTIRVGARGTDEVFVEVEDNGVGISPENINRIFAHGFTTRRNGHGFGLHSGALAARDLGGALSVKSEGTDNGATFTLALPLRPALATK